MGFIKTTFKALVYAWLIGLAFFGYRFYGWLYGEEDPLPLDRLSPNTEPSAADLEALALLSEQYVKTRDGINLHVWTAGKADPNKVLIFLHGFPESGLLSWRGQVKYFVDAGYQVILPDMRGYNASDKPEAESAYKLEILVNDILSIIDTFAGKGGKANLVGHDWGAMVSWNVAVRHSDRLHKLIILNAPYPPAMKGVVKANPMQVVRLYYMAFFNYFPYPMVEQKLAKNNFSWLTAALLGSNEKSYSAWDIQIAHKMWAAPNALSSMLKYYKANAGAAYPTNKISVPTLVLWGKNDRALVEECAAESVKFCENGRFEIIDGATHWVQHDQPQLINDKIHTFIKQ